MKEKISAVYQIKNMVTGERYVGSSKDVKHRWVNHKCPSTWNRYPNKKLYQDMQEYGIENFIFAILAPVEPEHLKQVEQEFIDVLQPEYNSKRANGFDVERYKATCRAYRQTEKYKATLRAYQQTEKYKATRRAYQQTEKYKATLRAYQQTEKCKEASRKYNRQLCYYNGETLFLVTLSSRFLKAGIPHPVLEAKKYIIKGDK